MARAAAPDSRERILDAVTPLFYEQGVRAVGTSRVIEAAGCGKNLLYAQFPSKADLVAGYLTRFRELRQQAVDAAVEAAGPDPADQLVAVAAEVAARSADPVYRGCPFRNYLTEFPHDDDPPARIARDFLRASRDRVDGLVGQLPVADRQGLVDRIWLVLDGLYASAAHPLDDRAGEVAVAFVRELVERATAGT
jgi:AcrR family transcriptional regulator